MKGEIVLIDRDEFEKEFFNEILTRLHLPTEVKHFTTPEEGLKYLKSAQHRIFVVLSVVDFGEFDRKGFELKKQINANPDLLLKSIPFVFMSYLDDKETIEEAYKLNIQGYFKKPMTLEGSTKLLSALFNYWACNLRPDEAL